MTLVPRPTRLVWPAARASSGTGSGKKAGMPAGTAMWSDVQMSSNPAASARWAMSTMRSGVTMRPNCGRWMPIFTA